MEDNNPTPGPKRGSRRSTASANASFSTESAGTTQPIGNAGTSGASASGGSGNDQSRGFVDRVKDRASAGLSAQKDRATDGLGSVANAVRQSTQQLRDQNHETVAQYVEQAADQIERFTNTLRNKNVGEIVDDAQRLARRQPALFIGGAFALGLVGARFLKSSPPDRDRAFYGEAAHYGGGDVYADVTSGRSVGTITATSRDNPGTESY